MTFTLFFALFLIAAGLGYLVKHAFNLEMPMGRYLTGIFIVLIGVHFLINQLEDEKEKPTSVWFSNQDFSHQYSGQNEYSVVFSHSTIDLRSIELNDSLPRVEVAVAFGRADVYLPDSTPYRLINNVAFGATQGKGPNNSGVGEYDAQSENFDPQKNHLIIEANVAFGSVAWH